MWKLIALAGVVLVATPLVSGCIVREERPPPPRCRAVWERGHSDRNGFWVNGHWRCID